MNTAWTHLWPVVPEKTLKKSQNKKFELNINMAQGRIMEYNGENRKFQSWIAEKLQIFKHFNLEWLTWSEECLRGFSKEVMSATLVGFSQVQSHLLRLKFILLAVKCEPMTID